MWPGIEAQRQHYRYYVSSGVQWCSALRRAVPGDVEGKETYSLVSLASSPTGQDSQSNSKIASINSYMTSIGCT